MIRTSIIRISWITGLLLLYSIGGISQAPDWMFVLEGTYVGRYEVPDEEGGVSALDARWDGKRSGQEDGFVLQISRESGTNVEKEAQMWEWNSELQVLDVTAIEDGQRISTQWFAHESGPAVLLTRGGNANGRAVIQRLRIERLPGQLRVHLHHNSGDGNWDLQWRYVLDDFLEED